MWHLSTKTPAAATPVTLADAKEHLRVHHARDDSRITEQIEAATRLIQERTERQLVTATLTQTGRDFPRAGKPIRLLAAPVVAIVTLKYVDTAGVLQTWDAANYLLNTRAEPALVEPAFGVAWPTPRDQSEAIQIEFTAGYGAAATDVPDHYRELVLQLVAHLYEHRGDGPMRFGPVTEELLRGAETGMYEGP